MSLRSPGHLKKNKRNFGTMSDQNKMTWKSPGQSLQIVEKNNKFSDILCTRYFLSLRSPGHLKKISENLAQCQTKIKWPGNRQDKVYKYR